MKGYVYIVSNYTRSTVYVGVTSNLPRRLNEHRHESIKGYSKRYHTHYLVYVEVFDRMMDAIKREKQLKGWKRDKKDALILSVNPTLRDLSANWM